MASLVSSIETLERDCNASLSAVRASAAAVGTQQHHSTVPLPATVGMVSSLVELLLDEASKRPPMDALRLLERAEGWCDSLETALRCVAVAGSSRDQPLSSPERDRLSPVSGWMAQTSPSVPILARVQAAVLRERVYGMMRDVAASDAQYPVAIRYAKRAHKLHDTIRSVVSSVSQRDFQSDALRPYATSSEGAAGDTDILEFQRLSSLFGPLRSARNLMNLCVLVSKVKRHHDAAQYAVDSVHILRPIVARLAMKHQSLPTIKGRGVDTAGGTDDAVGTDDSPFALLAAALFNLGSQLELCQRGKEAMAAFDEALDLADEHMGKRHPLSRQLRQIVFHVSGGGAKNSGATNHRHATADSDLPSVPCSMTQTHFVVSAGGSTNSRFGEGSMSKRGRPPPAAPMGGGGRSASVGDAFHRRKIATAPSSDDVMRSRKADSESRPPTSDGTASSHRLCGAHAVQLQPLRSASSPAKGAAWEDPDPEHIPHHRKDTNAPVAILDLSEALREQQFRERHTPTIEKLAVDPMLQPLSSRGLLSGLRPASSSRPARLESNVENAAASGTESQAPSSPAAVSTPTRSRRAAVPKKPPTSRPSRPSSSSARGASPVDPTVAVQQQLAAWFQQATSRQFTEYHRRFEAAQRIQQAWRCSRARLERFNRKQVLYHFLYLEQRAAVACIASAYRTWSDRRRLSLRKVHQRNVVLARAALEDRRQAASGCIGRAVRRFLCEVRRKRELMRKLRLKQEGKLVQYETASILVQRWWRLVRVRKAYWRRRGAEIEAEKAARAEAQRRDVAATKIQKIVRGVQGRAYVTSYRQEKKAHQKELQRRLSESTDCVRLFLQEVRFRFHRLSLLPAEQERARAAAAQKISVGWAEALQRRAMSRNHRRSRAVRAAAMIIQRLYRRYRARRELRILKTIHRTTNATRIDDEFRKSRAALRIQCMVRSWFARCRVRAAKASIGRRLFHSSLLLQRVARSGHVRLRCGAEWGLTRQLAASAMEYAVSEKHRLVTLVQSFVHTAISKWRTAVLRDAVEREELLIARRARREMHEDAAASKIQSLARMHHAKQSAIQERASLATHKALVLTAVVRIQCLFRKAHAAVELKRRKVAAKLRKEKQAFDAEVAHEVFMDHLVELERIQEEDRRVVERAEDERWDVISSFHRRRDAAQQRVTVPPGGDTEPQRPSFDSQRGEWHSSITRHGRHLDNDDESESGGGGV